MMLGLEPVEPPVTPPFRLGSGQEKVAPAGVELNAIEVLAPEQIDWDVGLTVGLAFTVMITLFDAPVQPFTVAETAYCAVPSAEVLVSSVWLMLVGLPVLAVPPDTFVIVGADQAKVAPIILLFKVTALVLPEQIGRFVPNDTVGLGFTVTTTLPDLEQPFKEAVTLYVAV